MSAAEEEVSVEQLLAASASQEVPHSVIEFIQQFQKQIYVSEGATSDQLAQLYEQFYKLGDKLYKDSVWPSAVAIAKTVNNGLWPKKKYNNFFLQKTNYFCFSTQNSPIVSFNPSTTTRSILRFA